MRLTAGSAISRRLGVPASLLSYFSERRNYRRDNVERLLGPYTPDWQAILPRLLEYAVSRGFLRRTGRTVHEQLVHRLQSRSLPLRIHDLAEEEGPRQLGVKLDREFAELSHEVPVSTAHRARWSVVTRQLFQISLDMGLAPKPTPKLVNYSRCGRCMLGCPYGAKWDSRRFLDDAVANGAVSPCPWYWS